MTLRNGMAVHAIGYPHFHALIKQPGDPVSASWPARNDGDEQGDVWLEVVFDVTTIAQGTPAVVAPGLSLTPSVSVAVPAAAADGVHAAQLVMMGRDLALRIFQVAVHNFTIDVSVPVGLVITPIGDPSIT